MPEERLAVFLHVIADSGPAAGHLEVAPACLGRLGLSVSPSLAGCQRQRPFKQMRSRVGVVSWCALLRSQTAAHRLGKGATKSSASTRLLAATATKTVDGENRWSMHRATIAPQSSRTSGDRRPECVCFSAQEWRFALYRSILIQFSTSGVAVAGILGTVPLPPNVIPACPREDSHAAQHPR